MILRLKEQLGLFIKLYWKLNLRIKINIKNNLKFANLTIPQSLKTYKALPTLVVSTTSSKDEDIAARYRKAQKVFQRIQPVRKTVYSSTRIFNTYEKSVVRKLWETATPLADLEGKYRGLQPPPPLSNFKKKREKYNKAKNRRQSCWKGRREKRVACV